MHSSGISKRNVDHLPDRYPEYILTADSVGVDRANKLRDIMQRGGKILVELDACSDKDAVLVEPSSGSLCTALEEHFVTEIEDQCSFWSTQVEQLNFEQHTQSIVHVELFRLFTDRCYRAMVESFFDPEPFFERTSTELLVVQQLLMRSQFISEQNARTPTDNIRHAQ